MRLWLPRVILLTLLAGVGIWCWRIFFPGPEQVVRKRLTQLAQLASISPKESPLVRFAHAQKLTDFFARDLEITLDVPNRSLYTIQGKDELREQVLVASKVLQSLKIEFVDISIVLGSDKASAIAHLTAKVQIPGDNSLEAQELKIGFKKTAEGWLINRAETVEALRQ